MMRCILACCWLLFGFYSQGQNLLTNPGFEQAIYCPTFFGPGGTDSPLCVGWSPASNGSPDYYNTCDVGVIAGVPLNAFGRQYPMGGGNAYVGIYTYVSTPSTEFNEYIMTRFAALTPGAHYTFTMHVSLADGSGYYTHAPDVLLTTYGSPDSAANGTPFTVVPQISFASQGFITDTANWVPLTATFTADSAYRFLIIGSFSNAAATVYQAVPYLLASGLGVDTAASYIYIDSVSLVAAPTEVQNIGSEVVVSVSPNPVADHAVFLINASENGPYALSIINATGVPVQRVDGIQGNAATFERGNLVPGCYYYLLSTRDKVCARGGFIVQ